MFDKEKSINTDALEMSHRIIEQNMKGYNSASHDERKALVTTMIMALGYTAAVMASAFLTSAPEDFAKNFGGFVEETMSNMNKMRDGENSNGSTSAEKESCWD